MRWVSPTASPRRWSKSKAYLKRICVSEVYSNSGSYDLLIKCYLAADEDIRHFVNERIQKVAGITGTMTTIAFNAFS